MILLIADNLNTRLSYRRYLRRNGFLCMAPPPADFEAAVSSSDYSAVLFVPPFPTALHTMVPDGRLQIAVGRLAYPHAITCFEDPHSRMLLKMLSDIEGMSAPLRAGALVRVKGRFYLAGYELSLTFSERAVVEYLLCHGIVSAEELANVCFDGLYSRSCDRQKRHVAVVVSRVNSKAVTIGGRKIIEFRGGYVICQNS